MNKRIVHDALILTAFTLVLGFYSCPGSGNHGRAYRQGQ